MAKYYYGNSYKDALRNGTVEIKTTDALRSYQQVYSVVIPADEIDDDDDDDDDELEEELN